MKRVFLSGDVLIHKSDSPDQQSHPPRPVFLKRRKIQEILVGRVVWIGQEGE